MDKSKFAECLKESKVLWTIKRFASEEDFAAGKLLNKSEFEGNIMLNTGINAMWTLVTGTGATKFDAGNAILGVGDSSTGELATQTGLIGTNKLGKGMDGSFPTYGTNQYATWEATFGSSDANFAWNEFCVFNGAVNVGVALNRKVSAQGTKVSGQVWQLTIQITLS